MKFTRRKFVAFAGAAAITNRLGIGENKSRPIRLYPPGTPLVQDRIDWARFLARHDLKWNQIPESWGEAPFLGNGRLAMFMDAERKENALRFGIDNVFVYDRRDTSWGWAAYSQSRYHVGEFLLVPVGKITAIEMRLDLYRAELRGKAVTDRGSIGFQAFVHATKSIIIISLDMVGKEKDCRWEWLPADAISGRAPIRDSSAAAKYEAEYGNPVKVWVDNPPGERQDRGNINRYVQQLLAGGGYTTAWREVISSPKRRTLYLSNVMSYPELTSPQAAADNVQTAEASGLSKLIRSHRRWWSTYYRASFLSLPETRLESFYWIQMYKYACVSRCDTGVIDTHGPWLQPTSWPYITWNLNTQISYWALQPSNRLSLAEGLFRSLDRNIRTLQKNVRPRKYKTDSAVIGHCSQQDLIAPIDGDRRYELEFGNLLWVCHNYWLQYRFSMDAGLLRGRLLPLLRQSVNFYLHILEEQQDGRLHLPKTYSPEIGSTRDCNYDLALLRWACGALIDACNRLHISDPQMERWKDVCARLTPFPSDANGFRIGADLPVTAHRHFSHLLMIYPLYLVNWDNPSSRAILEKSIDYWLSSAEEDHAEAGFTLAVGSSMNSTMGRGNEALAQLKRLVVDKTAIGKIFPNTMYAEKGQNIETPLAAAQSIHDMILQSWGGAIRIFPAVPDTWSDVVLHNFRTEGAFLVSALRKGGKTQWVRVKSLEGEPCRIDCDWGGGEPVLIDGSESATELHRLGPNLYSLTLHKGQEMILADKAAANQKIFSIEPLPAAPQNCNTYGVSNMRTEKEEPDKA